MAETKENPPKPTHRALIPRIHCRSLFIRANNATARNRSEERWLSAAVAELEELAAVELRPGGIARMQPIENMSELIERNFSDDAVKGIKLAVVQAILGNPQSQVPMASFADKSDLLKACSALGEKFRKLVEKEAKLPESTELDEDKPLELA